MFDQLPWSVFDEPPPVGRFSGPRRDQQEPDRPDAVVPLVLPTFHFACRKVETESSRWTLGLSCQKWKLVRFHPVSRPPTTCEESQTALEPRTEYRSKRTFEQEIQASEEHQGTLA